MTLLNVMNEILSVKESVAARDFKLARICEEKGLSHVKHIIGQALRRYTNLEKLFDLSNDYRQQAQMKCDKWELIAKSLLEGYSDNVFVSKRDLQDRSHHFVRYDDTNDTAVLDLNSSLVRPIDEAPVSLVIARDILYLSSIRSTAIISFLGELKTDWIEHNVERQIKLNEAEENFLKTNNGYASAKSMSSSKIEMKLDNRLLTLKGSAGIVLNTEKYLLQQLIISEPYHLVNSSTLSTAKNRNLSENLESIIKMSRIFKPMIWRWENEKQVKMTINSNTATKTCEITINGRYSEVEKAKQEYNSFLSWLKHCAVVQHPNEGKYRQSFLYYLMVV